MESSYWARGCDLDGWSLDEGPRPRRGKGEVSFRADILKGNTHGLKRRDEAQRITPVMENRPERRGLVQGFHLS